MAKKLAFFGLLMVLAGVEMMRVQGSARELKRRVKEWRLSNAY